jgi:hypothetical protein
MKINRALSVQEEIDSITTHLSAIDTTSPVVDTVPAEDYLTGELSSETYPITFHVGIDINKDANPVEMHRYNTFLSIFGFESVQKDTTDFDYELVASVSKPELLQVSATDFEFLTNPDSEELTVQGEPPHTLS